MENFKLFTLGFIMSISIIVLYFTVSIDNYIKHDVINKVELDSILDARLGSGCDLSMDSCDVCPY